MEGAEELRLDIIPTEMRYLRACKLCSLVKTMDLFLYNGCENCDFWLKMRKNKALVEDYTSNSFDGIISLMSPKESWVGKWQRLEKFIPGCYAISVTGELPSSKIEELKDSGYRYKSRDTSVKH